MSYSHGVFDQVEAPSEWWDGLPADDRELLTDLIEVKPKLRVELHQIVDGVLRTAKANGSLSVYSAEQARELIGRVARRRRLCLKAGDRD